MQDNSEDKYILQSKALTQVQPWNTSFDYVHYIRKRCVHVPIPSTRFLIP